MEGTFFTIHRPFLLRDVFCGMHFINSGHKNLIMIGYVCPHFSISNVCPISIKFGISIRPMTKHILFKVKVKFTLEQAQTGSRGIAVLFL
jgi:hypothetical protein